MNKPSVYSKEILLNEIAQGAAFEYLLFYGHTKKSGALVTETCCSQWFPVSFVIDSIEYPTAEHFMMAEKARLFNDESSLKKILESKSPKDAKALGRTVSNFDPRLWGENCFDIVVRANHAKFAQNSELGEWLVATAPKVLVEASPTDKIWGIGLARTDSRALDPMQWKGSNLLGFALMKVRDQIL